MKFVHIADMHFDTPFTSLNHKENLGDIRRLEQRKVFKEIINYIKENNIDYLFIAGDLYDHEYVKRSTIEYINKLFCEIPKTKIFISPGNHDPYIKNSYYSNFTFNENVHIFKNGIEKYEENEISIYGMAFNDFYMNNSPIENMKIENTENINILVAHCTLNGVKDDSGFLYNSVQEAKIKDLKFDYAALGHIHKCNLEENSNIVYSGSTISLGFDELGEHGMIVGEVTKESKSIKFVKLDEREFTEIVLNVEKFNLKEELIEYILSLKIDSNKMYKIVLIGGRNFEINSREILKLLASDNILKVKDETKTKYNIADISEEKNIRGMFVKELIKRLDNRRYS